MLVPRHTCLSTACQRVLSLALLILAASSACAQIPVEVQQLDGKSVTGRLTAITSDTIRLDTDGDAISLRLPQVVSLRITDLQSESTPPVASSGWTILATGDQLRVEPLVIDDVSVVTKWAKFPALRPVSIPLEVCRGIVFQLPIDAIRHGQVFSRLLDRRDKSDQVVLRNGDRIEGEFVDVSEGRIVLKTTLGEVPADMSQARSLVFNPDLISVPEHDGPFATLVLRDGSTLWANEVQSDGDEMLVDALAGFKVALPVTTLRELRFYGGRRVSMTTLPMDRTQTTPFLSIRRTPRVGRNVTGGLLSIGDRRFANGIGVAGGTDLTWSLNGEYESFQAIVGIDDVADGRGSVVCEVLIDGTSAWKSERLTGQSPAVTVPLVALNGASELTLKTHFADRGHVFDFANWCDLLLIRKE